MDKTINKLEELFKKNLQKIIEEVSGSVLDPNDNEEFFSYARIGQMKFNATVRGYQDIIIKNDKLNQFIVYAQGKNWTDKNHFKELVNQYKEIYSK